MIFKIKKYIKIIRSKIMNQQVNLEDVIWFPIEEILTWASIDENSVSMSRKDWDLLLESKRKDSNYPKVFEFIKREGFRMPLQVEIYNGKYCHENGHHRLAAAIELGYSHIPYVINKDWLYFRDFEYLPVDWLKVPDYVITPQQERELVAA